MRTDVRFVKRRPSVASEAAVRKLANPDHRSHISQVQRALRAMDRSLKVKVTAA